MYKDEKHDFPHFSIKSISGINSLPSGVESTRLSPSSISAAPWMPPEGSHRASVPKLRLHQIDLISPAGPLRPSRSSLPIVSPTRIGDTRGAGGLSYTSSSISSYPQCPHLPNRHRRCVTQSMHLLTLHRSPMSPSFVLRATSRVSMSSSYLTSSTARHVLLSLSPTSPRLSLTRSSQPRTSSSSSGTDHIESGMSR